MRRLSWRKSLMLVMAATLSGANLVSAALPLHASPASVLQIATADHEHHDACCHPARHAGCAAACAAQSSCSLTFPILHVRTAEAWAHTRDCALGSEPQTIPQGIPSLPESPPPRV